MTNEISNEVILEHLQNLQMRMDEKFAAVDQQFDVLKKEMNQRFDAIEIRLDRLEKRVEFIEFQIKNMGESVDELEMANLPERVNKLESVCLAA